MPTKKTNIETPPAPIPTPKREPKRASKRAPEVETDTTPKHRPKLRPKWTPKPAPISASVTTPESFTISIYLLPHWESDHSISPHRYGNGGKQFGEFHTEADAKEWLRRNGYYGHFAGVERINGKIGKSWHFEVEAPEEDAGNEDDLTDDDLSMLDADDFSDSDLLDPKLVKRDIKIAKLQAQLDAQSAAPKSNGFSVSAIDRVFEQVLTERLKPVDPLEDYIERIRVFKEAEAFFTPKTQNPVAPPQPQRSDDEVFLAAIARNPDVMERITGGVFKKLLGDNAASDESRWADVALEMIQNGQLAKIAEVAVAGLGGLLSLSMPRRAEQAQQPAPHSNFASPAQPQNHQAATVEVPAPIAALLDAIRTNANVQEVAQAIRAAMQQQPALVPMIDQWLRQEPHSVLIQLSQLGPEAAQVCALPHSAGWLGDLFDALEAMNDEADPQEQAGADEQGAMAGAAAKN